MIIRKYGILRCGCQSVPNTVYEMERKMTNEEKCEVTLLLTKEELTKVLELKKTFDKMEKQEYNELKYRKRDN